MLFIRMSITILVITTLKATAEGYGLPLLHSIDNDWKTALDDPFEYTNDHQNTLGTWNNLHKKAHKLFPSMVSPFSYFYTNFF